jgi:type II secretory pathway component PulF
MGLYTYIAGDGDARVRGQVTGTSLPGVVGKLAARDLKPTLIAEAKAEEGTWPRFTEIERIWLYRHLADLLASGMTLAMALQTLAQDAPTSDNSARLRTMSALVADHGLTMSEAMRHYPRIFGADGIAIVRAAEGANRLPECLRLLAQYLDSTNRVNQLLLTPAIYPAIIIAWLLAVFGFVNAFILPKFIALFRELGLSEDRLPWPTRVAMTLGNVLPYFIAGLLAVLVVLAVLYIFCRKSKRVQLDLGIWSLGLPAFGRFNRDRATGRILGVLALALEAGMPLDRALAAAAPAAGNEMMTLAMQRATDRARRGYSTAASIAASKILPPALLWHLHNAEKSGKLVDACRAASETYLARVEMLTTRMAAILEPILIILVGVCVGFIGYSVFLPLIGIIGELSS